MHRHVAAPPSPPIPLGLHTRSCANGKTEHGTGREKCVTRRFIVFQISFFLFFCFDTTQTRAHAPLSRNPWIPLDW